MFRKKLRAQAADWRRWRVESAGTWADSGMAVSRKSVQVMAEHGMNIAQHTARIISRELLEPFDLILTMESGHKEALQIEFPDLAERVFLLSEMAGHNTPVADPFGGSLEEYRETARVIDQMLTGGMQRILALVSAAH
jgi:protein-tyrosine-phosphatase